MASSENEVYATDFLRIGRTSMGGLIYSITAVRCLNKECNNPVIIFELHKERDDRQGSAEFLKGKQISHRIIIPEDFSKPQPDFIPQPIRDDYYEACRIRDLSPKASATLSRRCLQGMIRDFCGIARARLIDEINDLKKAVDEGNAPAGVAGETMDAIDAVRSVGNIGAHMEKDINVIVDVETGEAQSLIELIEMLFDEWYVARNKRQLRLQKVTAVATAKQAMKKPAAAPSGADKA